MIVIVIIVIVTVILSLRHPHHNHRRHPHHTHYHHQRHYDKLLLLIIVIRHLPLALCCTVSPPHVSSLRHTLSSQPPPTDICLAHCFSCVVTVSVITPCHLTFLTFIHTIHPERCSLLTPLCFQFLASVWKPLAEDLSLYLAPTVWNSLPLSLRKTWCFSTFKKKLKTHLFEKHLS